MRNSRSKRLFTFWLIAFVLFCVIVSLWATGYSTKHSLVEKDLPKTIKLVLSGVLLVIYCPPLIIIHNYASQDHMLKIKRRSLFLLVTVSVAALGTIITILFT